MRMWVRFVTEINGSLLNVPQPQRIEHANNSGKWLDDTGTKVHATRDEGRLSTIFGISFLPTKGSQSSFFPGNKLEELNLTV
jgi:hypothetical protein